MERSAVDEPASLLNNDHSRIPMKHIFNRSFEGFKVSIATPRSLPNPSSLEGRVVVLDLAFAHSKPSGKYPSVTHKLIDKLGDRLALFLDHHDSEFHADFIDNPRFILATKSEHGACPEMITPTIVAQIERVDTILCHGDFDGLASAAKWIKGGYEPYPGCDHDAWCVDTRLSSPSKLGQVMDRALRADYRDPQIKEKVLLLLLSKGVDPDLLRELEKIGEETKALEEGADFLAQGYISLSEEVVFVDIRDAQMSFDKTHLLLRGQELAKIAVLLDADSATFAAPFNSGVNFLKLFQVSGGMPTVLSLPPHRLRGALVQLGIPSAEARMLSRGTEREPGRR